MSQESRSFGWPFILVIALAVLLAVVFLVLVPNPTDRLELAGKVTSGPFIGVLLGCLGFALSCFHLARHKRRNPSVWSVAGFVIGPAALGVLLVLPTRNVATENPAQGMAGEENGTGGG